MHDRQQWPVHLAVYTEIYRTTQWMHMKCVLVCQSDFYLAIPTWSLNNDRGTKSRAEHFWSRLARLQIVRVLWYFIHVSQANALKPRSIFFNVLFPPSSKECSKFSSYYRIHLSHTHSQHPALSNAARPSDLKRSYTVYTYAQSQSANRIWRTRSEFTTGWRRIDGRIGL
jgi:hypothetical protein